MQKPYGLSQMTGADPIDIRVICDGGKNLMDH